MNGDASLNTISDSAIIDINCAISEFDNRRSCNIYGVNSVKFISAKIATDIPTIKLMYRGSLSKSRSKILTIFWK